MDERLRCVQDVHRPGCSIAEFCRRADVSRKTGYKWLAASAEARPAGLADGSHRLRGSPHATPASCSQASARRLPARLAPVEYPGHIERRRLSRNGGIRWDHRWVNVSYLLAELEVGFEAIDEGLWNVHVGPAWLGRFHEEAGVIVDRLSRTTRGPKGTPKVLPIR